MASPAIEPGKDYARLGPVLPAEMLKPPFHPKVAGRIAFWFGPIAGALISVVSLRRTGHPLRAKRVLRWTIAIAPVLAFIVSPARRSRQTFWPNCGNHVLFGISALARG